MSKCFDEVRKTLIENISDKAKELRRTTEAFEKMGFFSKCTETQRKQYKDLLDEIAISSQGLEYFVSIPQGF